MNTYLIAVQTIKDNTFIDDNVSDKMIRISSLDAQEQILEPILGTLLYDKLLEDVQNDTVSDIYKTLITKYIWNVMFQATEYKLYINLLFRVTNSAVVKDSNENSTAVSIKELNVLIAERESSMNYHVKKLQKHLESYPDKYPEYTGIQDLDGSSPDMTTNNVAFWNYDEE